MAKTPKKPVKPAKPKKVVTKTATGKAPKAATKAAAAKKVAKPTAKAKKTAPKNAAAVTKKTATKAPAGAKPKAAKPVVKPKVAKPKTAAVAIVHPHPLGGGVTTPTITSPATGANVTAGINQGVDVTTNSPSLGYVVTLQDLTTTPTPAAVTFNASAPAGSPFTVPIGGANFVAGRTYSITVALDAASGATPPNNFSSINVNCISSQGG